MDKYQKKLLNIFIDKYEKSKTYTGTNKVPQYFHEAPETIFPGYTDRFTSVDLINEFHTSMAELEEEGLISVKRNDEAIIRLTANKDRLDDYYKILKRREKRDILKELADLYQSYVGIHPVLDEFCREQVNRIECGKRAEYHDYEEAENILKLCTYILQNNEDTLERELSIAVFGDTKKWETGYRGKVCRVLEKYGTSEADCGSSIANLEAEKREQDRIVLEKHNIYANPTYVHFKGDGDIIFRDGSVFQLTSEKEIAFSHNTLLTVDRIAVHTKKIMTIENLTSYNRMVQSDTFMIYLSGYHNTVKQNFIRLIAQNNPGLEWYHFGDIDPDGFYILENLKRGTGIDFIPYDMGITELIEYRDYTKPLTDNDLTKAQSLIDAGLYCDIMEYIIHSGRKLEQEIISWKTTKKNNT